MPVSQKNDHKILAEVASHGHVKQIKRINFNKELRNGKAYFCSFSSATSKQLDHYIMPSLVDNKLDAVIIHVDTNDIDNNDILYYVSYEDIAWNIFRIVSNCKSHRVKDVFIFSIFV